MRTTVGGLIAVAMLLSGSVFAQAPKSEEKVTLRAVMQELAVEYVRAANALMVDDFKSLEEIGHAIDQHAMPNEIVAAIKAKLGKKFSGFEIADERSHAAARSLSKQAVAKNANGAARAFGELSASCVSCHIQFRATLRPLSD